MKRNNIQSESELTEDGSITNTCHSAAQKDLDTIIAMYSYHYQRLGLCHYFKAFNLLFEYFVIIYTCLRKYNFLIAFYFYYCFLFIIVFDAIYMLLPLHVLCSKIEIK